MQNRLKSMWHNILNPTPLAIVIFYIIFLASVTASIVILASGLAGWQYVFIFATAFLSLIYAVYTTIKYYSIVKNKVKEKLKNKGIFNYLADYNIRSIVFSTLTFTINAVYSVFIATLAIMSKSLWYVAIAVFYILISVTRAHSILKYASAIKKSTHIETQLSKIRTYKRCGIAIILLTLALGAFVIEMVINPEPFGHANILIYPVAAYTFYKITLSIINIFKARKYDDIIVQATRNLNLAGTTITLLTLQTNLFQVFAPDYNATVINAITGLICCMILIIMGLIMTISSNRKLSHYYAIRNNTLN